MSAIEWTDATWNPVTGCDRVSPGCAHCYALDLAARLKAMGQPRYQRDGDPRTSGPGFGVTLHPDKLGEPLRWRKPRMVFANSMSDLFHEAIPDYFVDVVFDTMRVAERHTFQVLTKRPERMRERTEAWCERTGLDPLPNVWLGVSIENRQFVGRADVLRETPAAVRFISAEPLLGPLYRRLESPIGRRHDLDLTEIDWLIVGGESGPEYRPMHEGWALDLRDRALGAGVAFFFKQWGGRTPKSGGRLLDGREWNEMPTARVPA
jgi:protein gp37